MPVTADRLTDAEATVKTIHRGSCSTQPRLEPLVSRDAEALRRGARSATVTDVRRPRIWETVPERAPLRKASTSRLTSAVPARGLRFVRRREEVVSSRPIPVSKSPRKELMRAGFSPTFRPVRDGKVSIRTRKDECNKPQEWSKKWPASAVVAGHPQRSIAAAVGGNTIPAGMCQIPGKSPPCWRSSLAALLIIGAGRHPGSVRDAGLASGCWSLRPSATTATHSASRRPSSRQASFTSASRGSFAATAP